MSEESNLTIRLSKAAREFNVGRDTIVEFLSKKGFQVDPSPNTKLTPEMYQLLVKEYQGEREVKNEAKKLGDLSYKGGSVSVDSAVQSLTSNNDDDDNDEVIIRTSTISIQKKVEKTEKDEKDEKAETPPTPVNTTPSEPQQEQQPEQAPVEEKPADQPVEVTPDTDSPIKVVGKIDLESLNTKMRPDKKSKEEKQREAKEKAEREKEEKAQAEKLKAEQLAAAKKAEDAKKAEEARQAEDAKKAEAAANEPKFIKTEVKKLEGPKILDKIELPEERKRSKQQPVASSENADSKKKKRKRIGGKPEGSSDAPTDNKGQNKGKGGKAPIQNGDPNKKGPKKDKGRNQPKHEEKVEEQARLDGTLTESAAEAKIPFSRKLKWLSAMLWGGVILLAFEHLWHGEIAPFFPFLTAMSDAASTAEMLKEIRNAPHDRVCP
mgnify:CR=1 FL=1